MPLSKAGNLQSQEFEGALQYDPCEGPWEPKGPPMHGVPQALDVGHVDPLHRNGVE